MLPPAAALRVPLSNPSAITIPGPEGWSKWTWLSIPPGRTRRPEASISEAARGRSSASATMRPSFTPTSHLPTSAAVTTVPPRMTRSSSIPLASDFHLRSISRGDATQDPCKLRQWRSGLQNDARAGLTLDADIVGSIRRSRKGRGELRDFHQSGRSPVYSVNGMAATSMPIASLTAIEVLRAGGNAVDAAVAACAVLAVVEPQSTGLGGDCFCLYAPAGGGKVVAVNGSGRSGGGRFARRDRGRGRDSARRRLAARVTIPGAVSGWQLLLDAYGTKGFDELLSPAIRCAEEGFPVHSARGLGLVDAGRQAAPRREHALPARRARAPRRRPFRPDGARRTRCAPSPGAARTPSTPGRSQPTWRRRFGRAAACRRKRISPTDLRAPNLSSRSRFDGAGSTSGSARRTGRVWSR